LTGGLVPSPSALLVLLAAIGLGRAWLGVVLVICYGIGMAATLTGIALLAARGRVRLQNTHRRPLVARLATAMQPVSAFGVLGAGLLLAARGAIAI
jgi:ABC-type nickel/cobalt efflux system permease component RcnA